MQRGLFLLLFFFRKPARSAPISAGPTSIIPFEVVANSAGPSRANAADRSAPDSRSLAAERTCLLSMVPEDFIRLTVPGLRWCVCNADGDDCHWCNAVLCAARGMYLLPW